MSTINLSREVSIHQVIKPSAGVAGAADISGSTVDMSRYQSALFVVSFGAIAATAVTSVKVQQGDKSDASDMSDLLGTGVTVANDDDDKIKFIDVIRPMKRYIRIVVDRATANAVVAAAVVILSGPRQKSTEHGVGIAGELHISPAEGTA